MRRDTNLMLDDRYFLSAVEVYVPQSSRAFAIVGDSITDGRGSDNDQNNRSVSCIYEPDLN